MYTNGNVPAALEVADTHRAADMHRAVDTVTGLSKRSRGVHKLEIANKITLSRHTGLLGGGYPDMVAAESEASSSRLAQGITDLS
jgi:hypothetical protein